MCGIAGASRNLLGEKPEESLKKMNDVMKHRGPDMGDIYLDAHMGLCHRRLSIIDLSEDGRQPMHSDDRRYHIVFNGEIYNFIEIKNDLISKGYSFNSSSDTEVLLKLYIDQGENLLKIIRGMFAFAVWDSYKKKLFIARDRIGKKPLYYHNNGGEFAFASELKSIMVLNGIKKDIDMTSVVDYLKYLFIPHPKTIYKDIYKLEPGHYLIYKNGELIIKKYWDIDFHADEGRSENDVAEELLTIIEDSVKCRLISDVPLGAFLSGGIDSSGIVSLMAKNSNDHVTTCTIGFDSKKHNEASEAKNFSKTLKTIHHEHYIKNEPSSIIRKLVWHFDEPFADSSMVPTYYVTKLARKNVTVALSGDGGDESFAGYEKYSIDMLENLARRMIPPCILRLVSQNTQEFKGGIIKKINSFSSSVLEQPDHAFYITNTFISDFQLNLLLNDDIKKNIKGYDASDHIKQYYNTCNSNDHLSKILYSDLKMYLPGDILVKVDRMSMANSLEVRSPLLDHKVIEFAAKIPSGLKIKYGIKKRILKEAFNKVLPVEVLKRKKHGFDVPLDNWIRNDLKKITAEFLLHRRESSNFFNNEYLKKIWDEHQNMGFNHGNLLWTSLIFCLWLENDSYNLMIN